jgi:hypothetical protein
MKREYFLTAAAALAAMGALPGVALPLPASALTPKVMPNLQEAQHLAMIIVDPDGFGDTGSDNDLWRKMAGTAITAFILEDMSQAGWNVTNALGRLKHRTNETDLRIVWQDLAKSSNSDVRAIAHDMLDRPLSERACILSAACSRIYTAAVV